MSHIENKEALTEVLLKFFKVFKIPHLNIPY
jgi:hypothetical protein